MTDELTADEPTFGPSADPADPTALAVWPVPVVAPSLFDATTVDCHRISAGDTVRLAVVRPPTTADDFSVSFEVWDPGGAQPPNTHPTSTETFWFLQGEGVAVSDGIELTIRAGQLLVLPPGSVHHIRNTGSGRL